MSLLTVQLPGIEHHYFRLVASDVLARYSCKKGTPCKINSLIDGTTLGEKSLLINCNLKTPIVVGNNSFLLGLGETFSDAQVSMPVCPPHPT